MTRARDASSTCDLCGSRTPRKRLVDLGPAGMRCKRCLDHTPRHQRRSLLRAVGKA